MNNISSCYESFYYKILNNVIYNNKIKNNKNINNILLFIENYFNPLEYLSLMFLIKKYNYKIYIIIENNQIYNKILENIKGEDCEKNIILINNYNHKSLNNIYFELIIVYHLLSIDHLKKILSLINNICNKDSLIYFYCSLCNEKDENLKIKNYLRNKIMKYTDTKFGLVLPFHDVIKQIEFYCNITIINTFKKNNYIIYGNNIIYQITAEKKI